MLGLKSFLGLCLTLFVCGCVAPSQQRTYSADPNTTVTTGMANDEDPSSLPKVSKEWLKQHPEAQHQ